MDTTYEETPSKWQIPDYNKKDEPIKENKKETPPYSPGDAALDG